MKVQQFSQVQVSQNSNSSIRQGSLVRGRVLSNMGGNSYVVSLAGHKLSVQSQSTLQAGQVFEAKIDVRGNKIFLVLEKPSVAAGTSSYYPADLDSKSPPMQLVNYLASLGLPPESESLKILQFLQENGFKFDPDKIRKIMQRNGKQDEKKSDKNQTALLLSEKGIGFDSHIVNAIIDGYSRNKDDEQHDDDEIHEEKKEQSFLNQLDQAALNNPFGPMTLFNLVSEGEGHWILLPFEWDYDGFSGVIRVFKEKLSKNVSKIVINCSNDVKKYFFVVNFIKEKISSVRFSRTPSLKIDQQVTFSDRLKDLLEDRFMLHELSVDYVDSEQLEGYAPENNPLVIVREEA